MKSAIVKTIFATSGLLALISCGPQQYDSDHGLTDSDPNHPQSDPNHPQSDPTILVDTYEKEIWKDCNQKVVAEKIVRRPAINTIKMNPLKNIPIDSSSFFNLETKSEYTPHGIYPGPGGDNYKYVQFCQPPITGNCDMAVPAGDNRIEYKYWSYGYKPCDHNPSVNCKFDVLQEHEVKTIRFTHITNNSTRICIRLPTQCPIENGTQWGKCEYQ